MQAQSSFNEKDKGRLYLVPTPIGNLEDITLRARRILTEADYIAAEDTRTSGILLEKIGVHNRMISFHKYNSKERAPELIKLLKEGNTIAEISDAGMPVISDPGYILVQECIKNDIPVVSLPGPSAFATALIASGFDAQPFTYYGFLPRKSSEQKVYFEMMNQARATSIFYEAPHRLKKTLKTFQIEEYGGAPLLGLKGLLVKTHGNSKAVEIKNSIFQCATFKEMDLNNKIKEKLTMED